jgi:cbb3-type cytochrome oxidase subunit 3
MRSATVSQTRDLSHATEIACRCNKNLSSGVVLYVTFLSTQFLFLLSIYISGVTFWFGWRANRTAFDEETNGICIYGKYGHVICEN